MIDATVEIRRAGGWRRVPLAAYLAPEAEEQAHSAAYDWIKGLRNLPVDGAPFRDRFTVRGDSLWWFTELYLHKLPVIVEVHRALKAVETLIDREHPVEIRMPGLPVVERHVVRGLAVLRGLSGPDSVSSLTWRRRLARLDLRARALTAGALVTADRLRRPPAPARAPEIAAFIHRAFWRAGGASSAESYVGPVLGELERRLGASAVQYVGVGPAQNFHSRRRYLRSGPAHVIPVERFAPLRRLAASREVWKRRSSFFGVLSASVALREHAIIRGVDCWPLVNELLAGVAWLQWPWSVRSMDEAGAALDAMSPSAVLTYAEAGGWGRALVLEARRRGIPSAGIQHGFIYRHWLNYLHEADEMAATPGTPPFPYPTRTLLFDDHAARHLVERGRFPAAAVTVTGSPRLDELVEAVRTTTPVEVERVRAGLGLAGDDALVLVATKAKEARAVLEPFIDRAVSLPGAVLVIKPHPAETAGEYAQIARAYPQVRVTPPDASLAALLAAARAVVTVNSTVAIDAGALGIPALVIGLPNNLSPFVAAGAFAGSTDAGDAARLLGGVLHDGGLRARLADEWRAVFGEAGGRRDAAARAADEVIGLVRAERPARRGGE